MAKYPLSSVFQKDTLIPLIQLLICFILLSICRASSYFNFNLNSDILDPTTTGFTITGSAANDWLGTSASSAGDIDNDGYDDIIVGASGKYGFIGVAYVIYGGKTSLFLNWDLNSMTLDPLTTGFTIIGNVVNDKFGYSVSAAGDIDNDGHDDIVVGALKSDFQGAAYVIYGGPRASRSNIDLRTATLAPSTTGFKITGYLAGDYFAYRVSTAGDVNKDGYSDLIIGAYKKNGGEGMVYVIYGGLRTSMTNLDFSSNPTLLSPQTTGFRITGNAANDYFGWQATTAGDINKDGYADIIIGAYNKNSNQGAAYVIYGGSKASMTHIDLGSVILNPATNGFKVTGSSGIQLGSAVSSAGDINGDGYDDIIVGAVRKNSYTGAAYVIYGGEKASMANWDFSLGATLNPSTTGFVVTESAASAYFGWQASPAGDVNKDGYADFIVSSYKKNSDQGAAYVIYGGPKASMANIDLSTSLDSTKRGFMITGDALGDQFGYSLSTGDFNNDGYGDIIIAAPQKNTNQGTVYVIHSAHCSANCDECTSATSCTQCESSFLSYKAHCFGTCPDATFTSTPTCQDCLLHCNQCSDAISCSECIDPYLLYQLQCISNCPLTTYASSGECKNCATNCDQCTDSNSCTQCTSPYLLYESDCVLTCPISTFTSPGKCEDCPANCYACTSQTSCEVCHQGYTLSSSFVCVSLTYQQAQEKASQAISSATQALGGVLCVGSATFPVTALVSSIVQSTRYLNLSVTTDLSEIYKTWDTDIISWDVPNVFSGDEKFKSAPSMFARYDIDSPFLANFWPTLVNIGIGLVTFIACFVLKKILEEAKHEGWAYSLVQKLIMGSFNFTLIQAYACLDNILFYLVIDIKTNPFNSFFSWASVISAGVFLAFGCLLIFFNFWTVKKYQDVKKQAPANENSIALEAFNERNKYWELFYSDFNDEDLLGQSFFAFLIMRSTLSSLITAVLYDYPLMQISFLIILDGAIIIFLTFKKPFNTLESTLCQYYFEIIALLIHICTWILALQDSLETSSDTLRTILSMGIIYLNTALVSGSIGFMFVEICKTIRHKIKANKLKQSQTISVPEENKETQNLTESPFQHSEPTVPKQEDWLNHEQDPLPENPHFFTGIHPNPHNASSMMRMNMEPSQSFFESSRNAENSVFADVNASHIINEPRSLNAQPILIRSRPEIMKHQRRNRYFNNEQLIDL